jgi:hypothetical protein
MRKPHWVVLGGAGLVVSGGLLVSRAQEPVAVQDPVASLEQTQLPVEHPECSFFGPNRDQFVKAAMKARGINMGEHPLSDLTERVVRMMNYVPPGSPTYGFQQSEQSGSIDSYIYADFQKNGITPAPMTTDWEFIRRITLDLTGRIPSPTTVLSFVANTDPQKRSKTIDQLLASPQWVDKWTMFYGDLFKNTVQQPSTSLNRFVQGRNAFYQYIHDSIANEKPYNQMASELIGTADTNSYNTGEINWILNGWVSNGPVQDTTDAMTAAVADTFLGITHVNCLLCHNGAGHLSGISLWGQNTTRYQAWQLSSYLSHTQLGRTTVPATPVNNNNYYWFVADGTKGYTNDYTLNTTSGNRPARQAPVGCKSGQPCYYVPPQYIFNGDTPKPGQIYRQALASDVTNDFQFARAAVNYLWAYFFGQGLVDPPDTFDPARLDPNNPPPAPWTLQPTNAALLNALATHFIQNGYNLKATMREIVNSQTYQLSSRYSGTWNAAWQPYFARKYVRRLWGEEIHDAISDSSGTYTQYQVTGYTGTGNPGPAYLNYAMQLPDVVNAPQGGVSTFLDSFLRGNRDDQPRKQDGSILQALNLMNNSYVESRIQYTGSTASQLIAQHLTLDNADLINTLYLTILSRYPTSAETTTAMAKLTGASNHSQAIQDLVWALYNKVDFVFNY